MNFKIDPEFKSYWPKLRSDKLSVLEASIVEEGLRENLVVWKERGILIDGHQRFSILQKHKIPIDGKITYLSFPDALHAKRWVHTSQIGRRGDVPTFLNVLHVLEFLPIYREEAKERQREGARRKPLDIKRDSFILPYDKALHTIERMNQDSGVGKTSIERVLYIKKHDPERFERLAERANKDELISIDAEYRQVSALKKAKDEKFELDPESIEKLAKRERIVPFVESVRKLKPSIEVQKKAVKAILANDQIAEEGYIENAILDRLPKKEKGKTSEFDQLSSLMTEIAKLMMRALEKSRRLFELREEFGDEIYFRALSKASDLRSASSAWAIQANLFNQKGGRDEESKKELLSN